MRKIKQNSNIPLEAIDLYAVLASRRQIAAIWGIEDVQEIRPDLDDGQAWQALQEVERRHDCDCGISWAALANAADVLYPLPAADSLSRQGEC